MTLFCYSGVKGARVSSVFSFSICLPHSVSLWIIRFKTVKFVCTGKSSVKVKSFSIPFSILLGEDSFSQESLGVLSHSLSHVLSFSNPLQHLFHFFCTFQFHFSLFVYRFLFFCLFCQSVLGEQRSQSKTPM